jgi:glycosyltransferase involved in cell wall biosynthesis
MGDPISLSVTVITLNEEKNVGRCLDSVLPLADEIVVVDSGSEDRTREICEAKGARVIDQPFLGYAEQKNFATEQTTHRHLLSLDADECLSPELAALIAGVKQDWTADGYTMNCYENYYGSWVRQSALFPRKKLRLWDREKGSWKGAWVHEKVTMQPGCVVRHLDARLLHYAYDSTGSHARQAERFSTLGARALNDKGVRGNMARVVFNPTFRFLRDYIARGGFIDGFQGLTICAIDAYMTFLKYAKLRALQRPPRHGG